MLATLFPKSARRYLTLPLFGPVIDDFDGWLQEQGYTHGSRRYELQTVVHVDRYLRRQGLRCIQDLTPAAFYHCWRALQKHTPTGAGAAHVMERFLKGRGLLQSSPTPACSATELQLATYSEYLRSVRGFSPSTLHNHRRTAAGLLTYLGFEKAPQVLTTLKVSDLVS